MTTAGFPWLHQRNRGLRRRHAVYLFGEAVELAGPREKWAITAAPFAETAVFPCLLPFGRPRFGRTVTMLFASIRPQVDQVHDLRYTYPMLFGLLG